MFEKLKTPAFLREARTTPGKPFSLAKALLVFLLVYIIASFAQSVVLTPVMLALLLSNEEYLASLSSVMESGDTAPMLEAVDRLLATDAVACATLFVAAVAAVTAIVYCRFVEKRSLSTMGMRKKRALTSSLLGALFALFLVGLALIFLLSFGVCTVSPTQVKSPLMLLLLFFGFLVEGFAEEVMFRGYITVSLARGRSLTFAILLGSFLFAYFHRAGAGITPLAFVNFFLLGILLSLYTVRGGNLFGAAVLHGFFKIGTGLLLGSPVSGQRYSTSLFSLSTAEGATLLHGGAFGLEGGIAITCALTVGIALLLMTRTQED